MPNRIIKESICVSKSLSETSILAQDLYKRLITYADDYGRFNCDPTIILARLFPREMDWLFEDEIWDCILELCSVSKIKIYRVNDRRFTYDLFGYFPFWNEHQRVRDSKTKCPPPDKDSEHPNDWALRRAIPLDLKVKIVDRDKCKCQICHKNLNLYGLSVKALIKERTGILHIDHIVPVRQGGRATYENLRLLCPTCNLSRPRNYTYNDIIEQLKANIDITGFDDGLLKVAESCGELLPNPIQSNPIRIQSESDILPGVETPDQAAIIELTLNTKELFPISQNQIDGWKELYPAVDVDQELRSMKAWLDANPKRRKTKTGIMRFVVGWLTREQDKGRVQFKDKPANKGNFEQRKYTDDDFKKFVTKMED